jgi:hypothetical protein
MLFLNFFGRITNGPPDLFGIPGGSRACGDCLFPLSASTKAQSSGQNGHDHDYSQKLHLSRLLSPQAAVTRSRAHGINVSLR